MSEPHQEPDGLAQSLNRMLAAVFGTLRNRTELFAVELQEEKLALAEMLALLALTFVLGTAGLVMFSVAVLLLTGESYRLIAAVGLAVAYAAGAWGVWSMIQKRLRHEPFEQTVGQLRRDWECLKEPE